MKTISEIFSKIIYFIVIVAVIVVTLNMFDKFKQSLNNNLYQCKVEFNSVGGNYIDTQTFKCGKKIENYSNPQKEGYIFEGWYLGDIQYNFDDIVVEDITLTAKWREKNATDTNIAVDKVNFLSSTYQMKKTDSLKLEVKVEPENATNKNVYYKSSNESIATVNKYGIVTAKKSGTVEITVITKDGGHKSTIKLTITSPVVGVKLNKEKIVLGLNDTYTLKATLTPIEPDNNKLTWSSSNPSVASVDKNGKVKAHAKGQAIITVTTVDGNYKAQTEVSVQKIVDKITLNKTSISLEKTKTIDLTFTISPANATDKTVSWTSSNEKVAKVDQNGKVTAISGGQATITVKSNDGGAKDTCKVTVISKVEGVSLQEESIVLGKGGSKKLKATIIPIDATNKDLIWSSSNTKIVKVDSTGKITALSDGSATITVKTKDGSLSDKCTVTVKDLVLKIELEQTNKTLNKGEIYSIKYKVTPTTATNKKINFSSSNKNVATVDSTGKITAVGAGKATITLKSDDGNATSKFTITVKVPLKGVSLNEANLTLKKGDTYNLIATFNPTDATNKDLTWKSSNTKVATVSSSGTITAVGIGSTTITITTKEGGYKSTCNINVKDNKIAVTGVKLNTNGGTIYSNSTNKTLKLTATVFPNNATNKNITWTSSNTKVATVENGTVTALAPGSTTITVTTKDGNYKATYNMTVKKKVIVVVTASQGVRMNKWFKTYTSAKNYQYDISNNTLKYVYKSGSGFDFQVGDGLATAKTFINDNFKSQKSYIDISMFFTLTGNSVKNYTCDDITANTTNPTYTKIAKDYSNAIKSIKDGGYNIKGFVISHAPLQSKHEDAASKNIVYSTNKNACSKGYRSGWKYHLSNEKAKETIKSYSNLTFIDTYSKFIIVKDAEKKTFTWLRTYTTEDALHWDEPTTIDYMTISFNDAGM